MKALPIKLRQKLEGLDHHSQRRVLSPRHGYDFSSNDYLGFATDLELRRRFKP